MLEVSRRRRRSADVAVRTTKGPRIGASHREIPRAAADDLYCVYTGARPAMPKGVLWRHDDIFFAAMGGGDPLSLGNHIARPGRACERLLHPGIDRAC